tara:strand:- start:393 stop:860 length:468 start_codon:yes stop_codon:yes gene_type:complete
MQKTFLDITVLPYRSLSKKGFRNLMFIVCFIFFSVGIFFWYIGAWPVFGFIGLDVFLLYYAFKINYRSGEIFETVKILSQKLYITRNFPSGKKQIWSLDSYWTKVEILNPSKHQHNLIVKSKNKVVLLGSFLNYSDKKKLLSKIQSALKNSNSMS